MSKRIPTVLWGLLIAVTAIAGCGGNHSASTSPVRSSETRSQATRVEQHISPQELAERVFSTYENGERLRYEEFNRQAVVPPGDPNPIRCVMEHGRNHRAYFQFYAHESKELVYEFQARPEEDRVVVREVNHRGSQDAQYVVPMKEYRDDRWDRRCTRGVENCMFYVQSWLGPDSRRASFFREIISTAAVVEAVEFDGRPCWKVRTRRMEGLEEDVWVDPGTYCVVRWRQLLPRNGVERDRIFSRIELEAGAKQQDFAAAGDG